MLDIPGIGAILIGVDGADGADGDGVEVSTDKLTRRNALSKWTICLK